MSVAIFLAAGVRTFPVEETAQGSIMTADVIIVVVVVVVVIVVVTAIVGADGDLKRTRAFLFW